MRVLLDTCVIIDALQHREPFSTDAEALLVAAADRQISGFVTAKSLADIYYMLHRSTHSDDSARDALRTLIFSIDVLGTSDVDCKNAASSPVSDFEDALMVETAVTNCMDCIVTRNVVDYKKCPVPVRTPSECLKILSQGTVFNKGVDKRR